MNAEEASLRRQIARDIQDSKPSHLSREYTAEDQAYDTAARIARGGLSWEELDSVISTGELASNRKTQYGVQLVFGDPVAAGCVKKGHEDEYVPRWYEFDTLAQADHFYGLTASDLHTPYEFGGLKGINRGIRWAEEAYGEWEQL